MPLLVGRVQRARRVVFEVVYCDDYLGYTLSAWLEEVRGIVEEEHCVEIEARSRRDCSRVDAEEGYDPLLYGNGELVVKGLPGEPGYLIELVKKFLLDQGIECGSSVD